MFLKSSKSNRYPIIISGFFRSGTSLLRRIVDSHPNISCPPEVKFFRDLHQDYSGDKLAPVRFFTSVRSMKINPDDLLDIFGSAFIRCHEINAKKNNKKRWADKEPESLLYLDEWFRLLRGKMLFVFVVRNPLDAISSLIEAKFETVPTKFEDLVGFYCRYMNAGIEFLEMHKDISYVIKYEDLVVSPTTELKKLFAFIGEDFYEFLLSEFSTSKRGSGVEDPKVTLRKEIHGDSLERFRRDLNDYQIEFISKKTADMVNKWYKLGVSPTPGAP